MWYSFPLACLVFLKSPFEAAREGQEFGQGCVSCTGVEGEGQQRKDLAACWGKWKLRESLPWRGRSCMNAGSGGGLVY